MTSWSDPKLNKHVETFRGSNCSGTDGATDRVLTLANTSKSKMATVYINGSVLHPEVDYTIDHKESASTITFKAPIWDNMYIMVDYFTG